MGKKKRSAKRERHVRIRSVRKDPPDLRKLAGALIALAQAQAEKDAEAQSQRDGLSTPDAAPKDGAA